MALGETSDERLQTLLLGACMLHWPILRTPVGKAKLACETYGSPLEVHTFGEIFQLLAVLRGTKDVPTEIRSLARIPFSLRPVVSAQGFHEIDVALVAPSSPIELTFRGHFVNRQALRDLVTAHLPVDAREGPKLLHHWLKVGLAARRERVRADAAAQLLALMYDKSSTAELARAVVEETRSYRARMEGNLRALRDLLGRPIGVLLYYFRYMPDGRPLSFPPGFHDELVAAAKLFDMPVFDPAPLVFQYGAGAALNTSNFRHYSTEFLPVAGDALVDFARMTRERKIRRWQILSEASHSVASSARGVLRGSARRAKRAWRALSVSPIGP